MADARPLVTASGPPAGAVPVGTTAAPLAAAATSVPAAAPPAAGALAGEDAVKQPEQDIARTVEAAVETAVHSWVEGEPMHFSYLMAGGIIAVVGATLCAVGAA